MSKSRVVLSWFEGDAKKKTRKMQEETIKRLVLQTEARAKVNIVDNDQVDTGFMLNSVYSLLPDSDTYSEANANASGRAAREMAPKAGLGGADGAVACGAEYAASQELRKAFLLPAAASAKDDFSSTVTRIERENKR